MTLTPLTLKRANAVVDQWHRHNDPVQGCRFCLGALVGDKLVAVAIIANATAPGLAHETTAEVKRLCVAPDAPDNACSFLYGAARRVWQTMGGKRILTYTLRTESGASLRGAGWVPTPVKRKHKTGKGWQSRPGRKAQDAVDQLKFRWEPAA